MASFIHIAEVAAILTIAYALGWIVGYVAHRLVAPKPAVAAEIPAERIAAVTVGADALVRAPVIEPVPSTPPPVPPTPEPTAPSVAESPTAPVSIKAATAAPEELAAAEPAVAIESIPGIAPLAPVAIPAVAAPPPMRVDPLPVRSKHSVEPEPAPVPEADVVLTATPAVKPGEAWSGEVRGRAPAAVPTTQDAAAMPVEASTEVEEGYAEPTTQLDVPLTIDLGPVGPDSTYGTPTLPEPQPAPRPLDEDAAMRAIEGGWSRVRTRALPGSPELSDVGAAVAAAQSAVEQVLAKAGIDTEVSAQTARPKGLPRPRNGSKDDLKRISGLGALDESTLNNLGVFHFDQIAGWSDAQVLWMENHVFARGRIGRENWQQQARDLTAA